MFMDRRSDLNKMSVFPNFTYRFGAIPIKIPRTYFVDINKVILKFIIEAKIPELQNIEEKN